MNRTIKFRVWDGVKMWSGISLINMLVHDNMHQWFSEKDVMQFTGLLDRNDKEVYEGDIFQCASGENKKDCLHQMVWRPAQAFGDMGGWKGHNLQDDYDWIGQEEVVGNIYENPSLMQV